MAANDIFYFIIPLVMLLIVFFISWSISIFNFEMLRIFKKTFIQFLVGSILIIGTFTFIYLTILNFDLIYAAKAENKEMYEMINCSSQEQIDNVIRFSGLKIKDYSSKWHVYIDMLYFSAMTFFTVGYGDITIKGALRIIPIIEAFLGMFFSTLVVAMLIINYQAQVRDKGAEKVIDNLEILRICLYRGYIIASVDRDIIKAKYIYYLLILKKDMEKEIKLNYMFDFRDISENPDRKNVEKLIELFSHQIP